MEELKQKLIEACNESGLPLEAIYFVTKDLWRDAEATLRDLQSKQAQQNIQVEEIPNEDSTKED